MSFRENGEYSMRYILNSKVLKVNGWTLKEKAMTPEMGQPYFYITQKQKKIILTRQFRLPTFLNGNPGGMLTEVCAGLLEQDSPEDCVIKEALEETGYSISNPVKVCEAYMSPGSVTEIMHLFIAEFNEEMKENEGGGLEDENEDIRVIIMDFSQAWEMAKNGEIKDAKTIILMQHLKLQHLMD